MDLARVERVWTGVDVAMTSSTGVLSNSSKVGFLTVRGSRTKPVATVHEFSACSSLIFEGKCNLPKGEDPCTFPVSDFQYEILEVKAILESMDNIPGSLRRGTVSKSVGMKDASGFLRNRGRSKGRSAVRANFALDHEDRYLYLCSILRRP